MAAPANGDSGGSARPAAALIYWVAALAALLFALAAAWRRQWVSDDAFITFRYAENLFRGLGLVFNPGERVEGYSNFLWTLSTALGLRLGADPERWTIHVGIACYLAAIATLAWNAWTARRDSQELAVAVPIAAGLAALHSDWNCFATGGLETSLFALEGTLLYVTLARSPITAGRALASGVIVGLMSLTRPDGPIFAASACLYVLIAEPRRIRTLALLLAACLALWVPYTVWRVGYYGDFFPNTYYAKSGGMAWYSQGAFYVSLYFTKYWVLFVGFLLAVAAWARKGLRPGPGHGPATLVTLDPWRRRALLAVTLALPYMAYVVRVGGDFMFARFLIPVTPFLLVLTELGAGRLWPGRVLAQSIAAGAAAAAIFLTPYPLPKDRYQPFRGVVHEPHFYTPAKSMRMRREGLELRRCFEGIPVRLAFFGGEARLVYYARPMVAIECVTGLTDAHIARQPLQRRGRVGHEKLADARYLLDERRVNLTFFRNAPGLLHLDQEVPTITVEMAGLRGRVLTWEPGVIESLRARGAVIQDFPKELDRTLEAPTTVLRWVNWLDYGKVRRFYFDQAPDSAREALLRRRIAEAKGVTPSP
jgi:hypothetical protein